MTTRAVISLTVLCVLAVIGSASEVTGALIFGWASFLSNVLPRVSVHWATLILAFVAFGLFVFGVHWFGVAWNRRQSKEGLSSARWRMRCSLASGILVIVLFAAGICMVGIVHQSAWLLTDEKPWYGSTLSRGYGSANSRIESINQSKVIALGMMNYHSAYNTFPPGGSFTPDGEGLNSWETDLLPFVGYYMPDFDPSLPWRDERNVGNFRKVVPLFINAGFRVAELSDDEGFGLSHYAVKVRVLSANKRMKEADITNGRANTILIGKVNANFQPWGHPVNWRDPVKGINHSPQGFGGVPYSGGANFIMADGSVRFVKENVNQAVLRALATPTRGKSVAAGDP